MILEKNKRKYKMKAKKCNIRGSPYKGVSINGGSWQVIQNIDQDRFYLGGL